MGEASVAVPALGKAVDRMTSALMYMDSSSGVLGNDLAYLMEVYARACRAAPPRPAGLAAWLVKLVCDGPGWPDVVLREWAPALGPKGLAEVARLVDERAAETRTVKALTLQTPGGIAFPHAEQAVRITRTRMIAGKRTRETVYLVASLPAAHAQPADLQQWARLEWHIENRLHWIRDVTFHEDAHRARTGNGPAVTAVDLSAPPVLDLPPSPTGTAAALHDARDQVVAGYWHGSRDLPDGFWELATETDVRAPVSRLAEFAAALADGVTARDATEQVFADLVAADPLRARSLLVTTELLTHQLIAARLPTV
ncbi:hypothetical protein AB0B83_28255 [Micromonospora sp. NPDC049060]|uniref:hypothetical protein n=1 Tax=unclassified Micromonospora TaxID=2617518 RepID=UPI0033D92253